VTDVTNGQDRERAEIHAGQPVGRPDNGGSQLAFRLYRPIQASGMRLTRAACISSVNGVVNHGPDWLLEQLLQRKKHSARGQRVRCRLLLFLVRHATQARSG
jgi:hypothetical protein